MLCGRRDGRLGGVNEEAVLAEEVDMALSYSTCDVHQVGALACHNDKVFLKGQGDQDDPKNQSLTWCRCSES